MTAARPAVRPADTAGPLSGLLRQRTARLHAEAERSGFVADLLRGRASRFGYVLYLRSLLPAYRRLEQELARHAALPILRPLASPALHRAARLAADLAALDGDPPAAGGEPPLPAAQAYAGRIAAAAAADPALLAAHAYVRYFGDLSGGQVLRRLLAGSDIPAGALSFYDFAPIAHLAAYKEELRRALDRAGAALPSPEPILAEAETAFRLNIALSLEVQAGLAQA